MPQFIPGLELNRRFCLEIVAPILSESFPDLRYSAAPLGTGFAVLGYDTAMSADHDWGPRFQLFFTSEDYERYGAAYDWLIWPQQHLLGVTAGQVYCDDLGDLTEIRHKLNYYPHDVWLYLLAAQWSRIGQEEAFHGRPFHVIGADRFVRAIRKGNYRRNCQRHQNGRR